MKQWIFLSTILIICLSSCRKDSDAGIKELETIEAGLEFDPLRSLRELDSLWVNTAARGEAWRMRWALLHTKAQDKAFLPHESDSLMRKVVLFFSKNGEPEQKLESYYYMGSVYRDLGRLSLAAEWYEAAAEYGRTHDDRTDKTVRCRINTQLADIYEKRQDFEKSLSCMKENYELRRGLAEEYTSIYEIAHGYKIVYGCYPERTQLCDSADLFFSEIYDLFAKGVIPDKHVGMLAEGLSFYSFYNNREKADKWFKAVEIHSTFSPLPINISMAKGFYYHCTGQADSMKFYLNDILTHTQDLSVKKEAAYYLCHFLSEMGDSIQAKPYVKLNLELEDSLFFLRQKLFSEKDSTDDAGLRFEQVVSISTTERIVYIIGGLCIAAMGIGLLLYKRRRGDSFDEIKENDIILNSKNENKFSREQRRLLNVFLTWGDSGIVPEDAEQLWGSLMEEMENAFPEFFTQAAQIRPTIKQTNFRLLSLHKLGLRVKQIATILNISESSASHRLRRIKEKIRTDN